ncbi:MAG: PLDc N-terminal domain-containing protein [Mucilaginibacter sp.]|uniref:PLDc N-terminal domain-containing protein n=1 Tax=Mucilaginibacter sp. TaxID=1882438 RepID=UPI003264A79A
MQVAFNPNIMHFIGSLISGAFGLIFFIINILLVLYAVLSILRSPMNMNTKLLWIIIIILIPFIGSLLYIFWGRNQDFV